MTTLERLEAELGRVHTVDDWRRVNEKAAGERTDLDLAIIEHFDGPHAAEAARAARTKALAPPAPPPAPAATKASARVELPRKDESWGDWAKRCGRAPLPVSAFAILVEHIKQIRQEGDQRLDALEADVRALQAKPHLKYCGVWEEGRTYDAGDGVTHHGSLWICKAHVATSPSVDHVSWQLAVKRGRDGKDAS